MMATICTISMLNVWNLQCSDCVEFVMVAKFYELDAWKQLTRLHEYKGMSFTKYFSNSV